MRPWVNPLAIDIRGKIRTKGVRVKKLSGPFAGGHYSPAWEKRVSRQKTWTAVWIGDGAKVDGDIVRVPIMWGFFFVGYANVLGTNIEAAIDGIMRTPQYVVMEPLEEELINIGAYSFLYGD